MFSHIFTPYYGIENVSLIPYRVLKNDDMVVKHSEGESICSFPLHEYFLWLWYSWLLFRITSSQYPLWDFMFVWKADREQEGEEERERERRGDRERMRMNLWLSYNTWDRQSWLDWSQEPKTQFGSPGWRAGTHILKSSLLPPWMFTSRMLELETEL